LGDVEAEVIFTSLPTSSLSSLILNTNLFSCEGMGMLGEGVRLSPNLTSISFQSCRLDKQAIFSFVYQLLSERVGDSYFQFMQDQNQDWDQIDQEEGEEEKKEGTSNSELIHDEEEGGKQESIPSSEDRQLVDDFNKGVANALRRKMEFDFSFNSPSTLAVFHGLFPNSFITPSHTISKETPNEEEEDVYNNIFPQTVSLKISSNQNVSGRSVRPFFQAICKSTHLSHLDISQNGLMKDALIAFSGCLSMAWRNGSTSPPLQFLNLNGNSAGFMGAAALGALLHSRPHHPIKCLGLRGNKIGERGATALLPCWQVLFTFFDK